MLETVKRFIKHGAIRWILWKEQRACVAGHDGFQGLAPEHWGCGVDSEGNLTIDDVSVSKLAATYGTPQHVVNEKQLRSTFREFLNSFQTVYPNIVLATSYKTNPVPYVLKTLHDEGSHAEVISHFELWLALKLGVPADKIILNGPGKGDDALRLAVEQQVRIINIDGPGEISKIARFAREYGVTQTVGLRVITSVGWSSQFGLSIASGIAEEAFLSMLDYPELLPRGLHLHLGTGIQSIETYTQAVRELIEFSERLRVKHNIEIDYFDLGGGFGVPTVRTMTEWDTRMTSLGYPARLANPQAVPRPRDYAESLGPLLVGLSKKGAADTHHPTVVLEPGRAITSSGQILLLSVIGKKPGRDGKRYVITDGGKNITMPLGWEAHQIFAATRMRLEHDVRHDAYGPLCHPGDIIVKNQMFPELEEGDLLAIMDAGAYFIPNQMNFSNPRPPVICVVDAEHFEVRRRETFDDIVRVDRLSD